MKSAAAADLRSREQTFGWFVRRILLYIGLALAALFVFTLLFALTVHFGLTDRVHGWFEGGWIGFVMFTGLLFWITVRDSRRRWNHWNHWSFCLVVVCLLTIHSLAFLAILRIYPHWRVVCFWPITVVEAGIFGGTLAWLFPEKRPKLSGEGEL